MKMHFFSGCAASLSLLFLSTVSCAGSGGNAPRRRYPSPDAVFDAYRQANKTGDWQSFYFLFTPQVQRDMVFEAYFACGEVGGDRGAKLEAIQRKFALAETAVRSRYLEAYKRKHGHAEEIDRFLAEIGKATDEAGSKQQGTRPTKKGTDSAAPSPAEAAVNALPKDENLFREVLYDLTNDKVGFFVAVERALEKGRKRSVIGDLEHVNTKGNAATGRAKMTILPASGESPATPYTIEKAFTFRRVNDGWLIDGAVTLGEKGLKKK